jgi:phosphatidylinositol kinase/protein kinase (PI-3  family)
MQIASEQFSATSDTCETWRLRMPNVHDSLLHWATIVHWRNIIYDYMIQHFMNLEELNPSLYSLGFKDKSRSVNSLARVARKHGLPSLANHFINNMYRYPTMEVSEAFAKIQEQCKAYSEAKDQQVLFHPLKAL